MLAMDVNPTTSFCMMYFHGNPVATRTAQLAMGLIQPADWFYVFDIWYYIKLPTFFHSSKIEFQIKKGTADLFMFIIPINHPLIHFGEGGGQQFWAICAMNICRFSVFFTFACDSGETVTVPTAWSLGFCSHDYLMLLERLGELQLGIDRVLKIHGMPRWQYTNWKV